ncbi:MAG: hypothetical protein ACYSWO_30655 [Planctomycetota bacterium]|jgi:hypothetical protein
MKIKLATARNENRQEELTGKLSYLYKVNSELRARVICRKEYDSALMRITSWLFNKSNEALQWVNDQRMKLVQKKRVKLVKKAALIRQEDNRCFHRECKALQRQSPYNVNTGSY